MWLGTLLRVRTCKGQSVGCFTCRSQRGFLARFEGCSRTFCRSLSRTLWLLGHMAYPNAATDRVESVQSGNVTGNRRTSASSARSLDRMAHARA